MRLFNSMKHKKNRFITCYNKMIKIKILNQYSDHLPFYKKTRWQH